MARFYASFDNSTKSVPASEYRDRLTYTNGSTLKTNLVNARAALSSAFYNVIDAGNRDGTKGIVLPTGAFGLDGTNLSFTNLYTSTAAGRDARWQSNPAVRPTQQITTGNATPVSPTDGGSILQSLYTDAQAALGNALAGIANNGPYNRLGLNQWLTLASLHHDHDLTYFAWDDFTPGTVQGLTAVGTGSASAYTVTISWTDYQYLNDGNPAAKVLVLGSLGSGGNNYSFNSTKIAAPGTKSVTWNVGAVVAGTYELTATVYCYDATYDTNEGVFATYINSSVVIS